MFTILIVDDDYLVRVGIRETIHWESYQFAIAGEANNGREGLAAALSLKPDVIITDIRMPLMDGVEFMAKFREAGIDSKLIVLSGYDEFDYARSAIRFGASAYILKPIENQQLIEAVLNAGRSIREEREARHHYNELRKELPAIKRQFVLDLLAGSIRDEAEIQAKLSLLELPLELRNHLVLVLKIDDFQFVARQSTAEQLEALRTGLPDLISGMVFVKWGFQGITLDKSVEETIVILQLGDSGAAAGTVANLKEAGKELLTRFKELFEDSYTLSVGIGGPSPRLTSLNAAYREALKAAEQKLLPGTSQIAYARDEGVADCHPLVRAAIAYLKSHFDQEITVEAVARELFVSPSHLMHLIKAELGKTLNDCLVEYRIERAKELLREKNTKIYEVCEQVGYSDTKYFSQLFKKLTGLSPSEYGKIIS